MYISSPYWTHRISRLDRVFRNTTLPLSPLSLCELSSLNHPSLIPPFSSPCDFEAFYRATVPTCARLRLPLSLFFSYRLSPFKISPRGLAPFGRTSWTARAFTTRASHQDYQLDFHLNLLPSFSLGLYCSSAELTYASTRTFALTITISPMCADRFFASTCAIVSQHRHPSIPSLSPSSVPIAPNAHS